MATISSGSNPLGSFAPYQVKQGAYGTGWMGTGKSYEDVSYERGMREATTRGSMGYGQLPRAPGEEWNAWMGRQSDFINKYGSSGPGLSSGASAMDSVLGRSSSSGSSRSSGSRGGGGGGGGGGGMPAMILPPTPVEFYMGPAPKLKPLDIEYAKVNEALMQANKPFVEEYQKATPGEEATMRALSMAGSDMAAGQIPKNVAQRSGRSAAALGFGTGLGIGQRAGGLERGLLGRDLAMTSMQLQQQAAQLAGSVQQLMQGRHASQFVFAPAQIADTEFSRQSVNQQLANQQLMMDWMNQPLPGQYDITSGSYVGFGAPGSRVTTRPIAPGIGGNYRGAPYNPFG